MSDEGLKNNGLTSKISIPHFDPACNKITAEAWIAYVDLARESAGFKMKKVGEGANEREVKDYNWTEPMTCTNAMLLLQGTANKWGVHLLKSKSEALIKWSVFKKLFKERFIQSLTLNEKMNLRDLKMTATESCHDFYDRCSNNMDLFYENEWENIEKTDDVEVGRSTPWEDPGKAITDVMVTRSEKFLRKTKDIELRLAFAAGLRESIKKQVLFAETDSIKEILKVAQRIESGLKELKKSEVAILDLDDEDEENVNVNAVNFKSKKKSTFKFSSAPKSNNQGGQLKCYYCDKTGHFKSNCITMKNDRKKGIFKSNTRSSPSKPKFLNSLDADDSDSDDEPTGSVRNCQTDVAELLNFHSV